MIVPPGLRPSKFFRHGLVHNVFALYAVQICTYAMPLLTFPYLARVLGPAGWGAVVFSQAIGSVIAILVEYGFDLSATRETSRHRGERKHLSELVSGVLGAKVLLAVLGVTGALLLRRYTHRIAPSSILFWSSAIWGSCQGINMLWYFQGLERMRLASALEIGGKVLATLSIFVLVRHPADGWKVLASQAVGCVVAHGVTVAIAYFEVGFRWPRPALVWRALSLGWSMFLYRAAQGVSGSINGLVLGFSAPLAALGEYAGAERITRAFQQGLWPVNQALYPRQSEAAMDDKRGGMKVVRFSIYFLGALSLIFAAVICFAAPWMVHVVLGAAFHGSIPTLRVFSLWIPLVALTTVITFQLLLPNGLDRQFNLVILASGIVNVTAALLLAPRFEAMGIAMSAVVSQFFMLGAFCYILRTEGLNPFVRPARNEIAMRRAA